MLLWVRKLRTADALLGEGKDVAKVARALDVSGQTYHMLRNQYGGLKADDAKRPKELEREDGRLKRTVGRGQARQVDAQGVGRGNLRPRTRVVVLAHG